MSNRARNLFTRKLTFAAAFVMVSAIATLAAFGPQALSLQRFFIGASAEAKTFKEVESQLHAEPSAAVTLPGGTLSTARSGHTATLLADGKVLIVGGSGDTSAEVFDPADGTSVATGNTNYARTGHTATRLADGRVLITGGGNTVSEIYDPATGTFSNGPEMTAARSGHTATAVGSNVIVTGGGSDSVEVFDGTSFASAGTLTTARTNHSAVAMNDGRVFIAGGTGSDTAEIYNPADGTSVATGNPLAHARAKAHLRVLPDGKVQIIGGNDDVSMEVYDPAIDTIGAHVHLLPDTDTCTGLRSGVRDSQTRAALFFAGNADASYDRTGHTITEVAGNRALVIGGTTGGSASNTVTEFASSPATITTDKLDYAPGETVTFNGTNFAPGETVRVVIHEDPHTHLERNFEAVADASGNITGSYLVEEHDLNVKFIVNARGLSSNLTAQTAFTDAITVRVLASPSGTTFTLTKTVYTAANCSGSGTTAIVSNVNSTTGHNAAVVAGSESVRLQASISSDQGSAFDGWASVSGFNVIDAFTICVNGAGATATRTFTANYSLSVDTTTTVSNASATYGDALVTLNATVDAASGADPSVGSVTFTVKQGGTTIGVATTDNTIVAGAASVSYALPVGTAAGPYTIEATYNPGSGFNTSSGTGTLTIDQKALTITAANKTKTFGDAVSFDNTTPSTDFSVVGLIGSDSVTGITLTSAGAAATASAGSYNIVPSTAVGTGLSNYSITYTNGTLTVDKAVLNVNADNKTKTFGQGDPAATYTFSGFVAGSGDTGPNPTGLAGTANCSYAAHSENAGTYNGIIICGAGDLTSTNYTFVAGTAGNLTIEKAVLNVNADNKTKTFGQTDPAATYTFSGFVAGSGDTGPNPAGLAGSANCSYAAHSENAGTYNGVITCGPGSLTSTNYTFVAGNAGNLTIDPAQVTVTVMCPPGPYTFNGSAITPCSAVANGGDLVNQSLTVNYTDNVNAGTATASASYPTGGNYIGDTDSATFTIDPAQVTVTVTCPAGPYTFNGSAITPCSAVVNGGDLVNQSLTVNYTDNVNAGTATASASYPTGGNYFGDNDSATFTIDRANPTVTATGGTFTYDGNPHTGSCSVTGVGGADLGPLAATHTPDDPPVNAGSYTVNCSYAQSQNYNAASDSESLTIDKADATCDIQGYGPAQYDGSSHGASGTCRGVLEEPLAGLDLGAQFTNAPGGTANWTFTDVTGNYNDDSGTAEIVITQVLVTVTASSPADILYGSATPTVTASYSGFVAPENESVLTMAPTCGTAYAPGNPVGPYTTSCSGAAATNYTFSYVNGSFDVLPVTLHVNAVANSKVYGNPEPTFSFTLSGFVLGEDPTTAGVTGTANCSRTAGETVLGSPYTITCSPGAPGNLAATNYVFATGTTAGFSITPKALVASVTANNKVFDGNTTATLTGCTFTNLVGSDVVNCSIAGASATFASHLVGTWTVTATGLGFSGPAASNYSFNGVGTGTASIGAWALNGFHQPVGTTNTYTTIIPLTSGVVINTIKGGQTVPLKFNIFAGPIEQTQVSAIKSITFTEVGCPAAAAVIEDPIDVTTTGGTTLRYSGTPGVDGQFIQNWQTPKAPDKCYRVVMTALDDSKLVAFFKTKK